MSTPETIKGPEYLTPGHFYHHAGLRGILYFAASSYWPDPTNGERVPQPGTECMITLNGDLPGAFVSAPEDGSNEEFWKGFYPAPGLIIAEHILDGLANVAGQLKVLEREVEEPALRGLTNTVIGTVQRVALTVKQLGHEKYAEALPVEIAAKDRAIHLLGEHINLLVSSLGDIAKQAAAVCNSIPSGTRTYNAIGEIANEAARLTHLSPYHPEE